MSIMRFGRENRSLEYSLSAAAWTVTEVGVSEEHVGSMDNPLAT